MQLGTILSTLMEVSDYIDNHTSSQYLESELTLNLAKIVKLAGEVGEAAEAYITMTGGNYRKPATFGEEEYLGEVADVVLTGILLILHHTGSPAVTGNVLVTKIEQTVTRMQQHKAGLIMPVSELEPIWQDRELYTSWIESLCRNIPSCCWDEDQAIEGIIDDYVHHLEGGGSKHKVWCSERAEGK